MTAELKPYSRTKDSGIAWLGMIPEHWKIVRQRYLCSTKTGTRDTVHQVDGGKYPFFVRSQTAVKIDTYSFDGEAVLTAGDGDIGKIFHYINGKFDFHQRVYKFSDFREVLGKFYFYYASANLHQEVLRLSAKSTVDSIRLPMLQNFPVVIPSVPEQVAIARYLDYVDVRVRRLTEAKRKLIGLLTEYKQAIIHRAVTRGLDPNVPLKDSGIEWLGMVPQHWDTAQVKRHYSIQLGKMLQNRPETDGDFETQYLKAQHVQWFSVRTADAPKMWASRRDIEQFGVSSGDLLVCEGGEGGRSGMVQATPPGYIIQNALHRVRPLSTCLNEYLLYVMNTISSTGWFTAINNKATIAHFTCEKFGALKMPIPPVSEQVAIVEYLDRTTAEIDIAVARAERQIELLNEYRTRLIADVVTGKLDVRDVILDPEEIGR